MDFLTAAYGVIKAIPIVDSWFKNLFEFYLQEQIKAHDAEFVKAMDSLINKHDQTDLETAIGSTNAGKPAVNQDGVDSVSADEFER